MEEDGLKNFIELIRRNFANIITIINGKYPTRKIKLLESLSHKIIFRKNSGRDFSAYRIASLEMYKDNIEPERVLYVNGSIMFFDSPQLGKMLEELLCNTADIVATTDNVIARYHVGTYCF